mgnify:CR=1 FL=1|tara:strand:- start:804 stop:1187 length:384 start_codon:yes stop_codon:yes gene_type:complete
MLVRVKYPSGRHGRVRNYSPRRLQKLLDAGKIISWEKCLLYTPEQRDYVMAVKALSCTVCDKAAPSEAHHSGTGMGRRKNHLATIPVCTNHHPATQSCQLSRREWEREYGTEQYHLDKTQLRLKEAI